MSEKVTTLNLSSDDTLEQRAENIAAILPIAMRPDMRADFEAPILRLLLAYDRLDNPALRLPITQEVVGDGEVREIGG